MSAPSPGSRLASIDFVRGVVMILMALDHVRDFLYPVLAYGPTDLGHASTSLFLTRWVTHFCAPVFVFLAGTSAYLWRDRGRSSADLSRFLLTRGLWLIVLELTIIRFAWVFDFDYTTTSGMVIWAIGWSMIALAGLSRLPIAWCTGIGIAMIALHNLADGVAPNALGSFDWLWTILHEKGAIEIGADRWFFASYPLVPWIGVMAAGFGFGHVMRFEPERRRQWLLRLGVGLSVAFVVLRAINAYGDMIPWSSDDGRVALAFINTAKYPPSLAFLLMTLGPAILLLRALDDRRLPGPVIVFGRVPMFYYIAHLFAIHLIAVAIEWLWFGSTEWTAGQGAPPAGWGLSLPWIYAMWAAVIAALYPLCRWYAGVRQRSKSPWLSYL